MNSISFTLLKKVYSTEAIHSAILTFESASVKIDEDGEYWLVAIDFINEKLIQKELLLRRIDEFVLRESLEKKFKLERDEIITLAFGQE